MLDYQEHLFRERTVTTHPFSAADAAIDGLATGAPVRAAVLLGCETA